MNSVSNDSFLSRISIAAPCSADWDAMPGTERIRNCGDCKKNVYNISDMTEKEAEAFLLENNTSKCVTYFQRQDGTILTDNCPVGLRRIRNAWRNTRRVAALILGSLFSINAAFSQNLKQGAPEVKLMGKPVMNPSNIQRMGEIAVSPNPNCAVDALGKLTKGKYALKTPKEILVKNNQLYVNEGDSDFALNAFESTQSMLNRAMMFEHKGNFTAAETYLKLALKLDESQTSGIRQTTIIKTSYALLLRRMHREKEATKLLSDIN